MRRPSRNLADQLREHLRSSQISDLDGLVFSSTQGNVLRHSNFRRRVWLPAVEAADVPDGLLIHELRHTCASLLIVEGAHPKVVQQHLGHSSITVTMDRYGHLFPSQMEEYAARLDSSREAARQNLAASTRPGGVPVVALNLSEPANPQ